VFKHTVSPSGRLTGRHPADPQIVVVLMAEPSGAGRVARIIARSLAVLNLFPPSLSVTAGAGCCSRAFLTEAARRGSADSFMITAVICVSSNGLRVRVDMSSFLGMRPFQDA
jgi:hypothetical protein